LPDSQTTTFSFKSKFDDFVTRDSVVYVALAEAFDHVNQHESSHPFLSQAYFKNTADNLCNCKSEISGNLV
jgi:hypothetical protein